MMRLGGRPGNRAPLNVVPRAVPTNRIPGALLAPPRLLAQVAAGQVESASTAAVIAEVEAGVPPDFTAAIADLEAARIALETATATLDSAVADLDARVTALEP